MFETETDIEDVHAQELVIDALAALRGNPLIEHPAMDLVRGLQRLPSQAAPLWGCFYGRRPLTELAVWLNNAGPVDSVLIILVWRGAELVPEERWRIAIDRLPARAAWIVRAASLEVA